MQPLKRHRLLWHADKVFFGVVMAACALATASFWNGESRPNGRSPGDPDGDFARTAITFPDLDTPRLPSVAADLSTDPDEYLPRQGEHSCVGLNCIYIVPDTARYCPVCGADQHDRDRDGMTDEFETCYEATDPDVPDGEADYDGDKFTNLEEFLGGSNPDDAKSIPGPVRLVAVDRELVDALFRGFARGRDGAMAVQINWGNDRGTEILNIGQTFRGYRIERLEERLVTKRFLDGNVVETAYTLVLRRPGEGELRLPRNEPVREPEHYGIFASVKGTGQRVRAYAGETVRIDGHSYIVHEVSAHSARLTGDRQEEYNLELRPEK